MGGGAPPALASAKTSLDIADPSEYGGRVLKKKSREKADSEKKKIYQQQSSQDKKPGDQGNGMTGSRDLKGRIVFTKPERELLTVLSEYKSNGLIKYPIVPQYPVSFGNIEYPIDFAIPHLKIGIEADGEVFHSAPKQIEHDKERDMKLSQSGWTILRFKDSEIEKQVERVLSTIVKTIMQKEMALEKQKQEIK